MKVQGYDIGTCGVEQLFYAGEITFDTDGASTGVETLELPAGVIVTRATAVVNKAFNAGTTNVLTVGTNDDADDILSSSDITEGTAGVYTVNKFVELSAATKVKIKYTQTGTAATAGSAEIYLHLVRIPV